MSGFRGALTRMGLVQRAPRACTHRKLSTEMLALFQEQAGLHARLLSYADLAELSGLTLGSVRGLMALMIRERRMGIERTRKPNDVSRGTQVIEAFESHADRSETVKLASDRSRDPGQSGASCSVPDHGTGPKIHP